MRTIKVLTTWINQHSGSVFIVICAFILIQLVSFIPYINILANSFGTTFVAILSMVLFRVKTKIMLILSAISIFAASFFYFLQHEEIAEQIIIVAFNMVFISFILLVIRMYKERYL